jgi:hypothetical protein
MTMMSTDFRPVTEVVADSRKRIAFGRVAIHAEDRFLVSRNEATGEILLTPVSSIPTRELHIWENQALLESVMTGLAQASQGEAEAWPEMDAELDALNDEEE